jgi:hypothetical protein
VRKQPWRAHSQRIHPVRDGVGHASPFSMWDCEGGQGNLLAFCSRRTKILFQLSFIERAPSTIAL